MNKIKTAVRKLVLYVVVAASSFVCGVAVMDGGEQWDFDELCGPSITSLEYELSACFAAQDKVVAACEAIKAFGQQNE